VDLLLLDASNDVEVTDIDAPADTAVAQRCWFINISDKTITINEGAHVVTGAGGSVAYEPGTSGWMHWSPTLTKWVLT